MQVNSINKNRRFITIFKIEDPNNFARIKQRVRGQIYWTCFTNIIKGTILFQNYKDQSIIKGKFY